VKAALPRPTLVVGSSVTLEQGRDTVYL